MNENQEHFRHILFFYYKKGKNAVQPTEKICHVYEEDALTRQIANFDVKDAHRSSLKKLNIDHKTILKHLHKAHKYKEAPCLMLHDLTVKNLLDRISICKSLLKYNKIEPFLKRLITVDEMWIHDNARSYTSSLMIRQKLNAPYSPDLAPSDYHLFRSLQPGINLTSKVTCENHLSQFFTEKLYTEVLLR
ncbi:SETMR methyltransferase, partial [Pseudoatta argentina]